LSESTNEKSQRGDPDINDDNFQIYQNKALMKKKGELHKKSNRENVDKHFGRENVMNENQEIR
jgi:hypothetical protein